MENANRFVSICHSLYAPLISKHQIRQGLFKLSKAHNPTTRSKMYQHADLYIVLCNHRCVISSKNNGDIRTFNILFAGYIGHAHSLDTVIIVAQRLKRERSNIQFTLIGTGVDLDRLCAATIVAKTDNILFLPPPQTE